MTTRSFEPELLNLWMTNPTGAMRQTARMQKAWLAMVEESIDQAATIAHLGIARWTEAMDTLGSDEEAP